MVPDASTVAFGGRKPWPACVVGRSRTFEEGRGSYVLGRLGVRSPVRAGTYAGDP